MTNPEILVRALRVPHWGKNLLIFVPIVAAHQFNQPEVLLQGLLAFIAFCCAASGSYLLNDVLDLESDRMHSRKSRRPVASGEMRISSALVIAALLAIGSVFVAAQLLPVFWLVLAFYACLTVLYSIRIKRLLALDVVVLGVLFALRIYAGGAATDIELSFWLMAFTFFLFFSLAVLKRYSDLICETGGTGQGLPGRAYRASDIPALLGLGIGSSLVSILILALYINGEHIATVYTEPVYIWLACPVILFWVMRIWLQASRGLVKDDPVIFALKDIVSYVVAVVVFALMVLAR